MIDPQALWILSRATGLVGLLLLTAVMVVGILTTGKVVADRMPAMVKVHLHRNMSLLMTLFVILHVATAIMASYVDLHWLAFIIPFAHGESTPGRICSTPAMDLIVAVMLTGAFRRKLPTRVWQIVHLTSYLIFPLSAVHTYELAGHDSPWMWPVANICCGVVLVAALWRLREVWQNRNTRHRVREVFRAPVANVNQALTTAMKSTAAHSSVSTANLAPATRESEPKTTASSSPTQPAQTAPVEYRKSEHAPTTPRTTL